MCSSFFRVLWLVLSVFLTFDFYSLVSFGCYFFISLVHSISFVLSVVLYVSVFLYSFLSSLLPSFITPSFNSFCLSFFRSLFLRFCAS